MLRRTYAALATLVVLATTALALPARAGAEPSYEDGRLARALADGGFELVDAPEGRAIRKIHVVRHDVLAEDEPFPTVFNVFHTLTHESAIRRELLFAPGDPWSQPRIDETMRNLRALGIFTIVRIVAVKVHDPGEPEPAAGAEGADGPIDILVLTRDIWSIRIETSFQVTDGFIDELAVTLVERNLAGRNKNAALRFTLLPRTFSIGDTFYDPRLFGGALALTQTFDLIFNRSTGSPEGSRGRLAVGSPFRNLRQAWSWEAAVSYDDVIGRQLSSRDLLTYDVPETPAVEAIPRVWDANQVAASAQIRYQTGTLLKHRVAGGVAGSDRALTPRGDLSDAERDAFERDVLAPDRRQIYPFVTWTGFTPEYETFIDLASFGLSEDVRLGPWWVAQLAFPLEAFGSSDDALFWSLAVGFVAAPGGGLIDLQAELAGRLEQGRVIDQQYTARLRGATPRFVLGRLVANAYLEARVQDTASTFVTLGGDNGLRGYASQAFYGFGANRVRFNAEWRTPPLVIASAHIGGVVFWDAGAVWNGAEGFDLRQSAGLGVRLLFPQFNRFTFRFDLGVPLDGDGFTVLATFGSLQAVPLTSTEDTLLSQ